MSHCIIGFIVHRHHWGSLSDMQLPGPVPDVLNNFSWGQGRLESVF